MNLERLIAVSNTKSVYRDGDKCIKVFNENYSKADVLNEALNLARVEQTGLSIPRLSEVTAFEGRWAIVMDYIKGKTLAQLISEQPQNKREYIDKLVDIQLDIHSKTCPLLTRLRDKAERKIGLTELKATTRYYLHNRLESMPRVSRLCHGDLDPTNIIIAEDSTPYIIDWSHATQGDPCADAARTYLLFWLEGDIDGAEHYLASYCEKSGADRQTVEGWMPIVAAERSVNCNEKQREFLLGWVTAEHRG